MATAALNLGSPPDANTPPAPQGNMGTLTGMSQDAVATNQAFVQRVRVLMTGIDDLSRQFPAFSAFGDKAQTAIQQGMVEVMRSSTEEGSAGSP